MKLILFDDPGAARLRPFTWLRPAAELLLGGETTESRWRDAAPAPRLGIACRPLLVPFGPDRVPLDAALAGTTPEEIWVSDLVLPGAELVRRIAELEPDGLLTGLDGAALAFRPGAESRPRLAAAAAVDAAIDPPDWLGPLCSPGTGDPWRRSVFAGPVARLDGLGDLVRLHEERLSADLEARLARDPGPGRTGDGFAYRPEAIRTGEGCVIDAGAVLDAREGPILLGERCHVFPHTWIRGPFRAAADCLLLGGRLGRTSLERGCRVRGEVESSVFLSWSNKAHEGFVGHSYLGEWVNLGALTTTSNLKNNYSAISLSLPDGQVSSGLVKLGAFLGDHVKTRIGSLITCGTIVGVGANLIGEPAVRERRVPDFSWGNGPGASAYDVDRFLATAEVVRGRRGLSWSGEIERLLRAVHAATRGAGAPPSEGPEAAPGGPGGRR